MHINWKYFKEKKNMTRKLTSLRSTKSARRPPVAHILSTTLSTLLLTLHLVFPRVSRAWPGDTQNLQI